MEHIKNSNIGCLVLQVTLPESFDEVSAVINSERYDKLATNTINSLKKFHPEIDLYYVTDKNIKEYKSLYLKEFYWSNALGINKYILAYNLMKHFNYDKMIILGCDTIVCSRMDEFLDNDDDGHNRSPSMIIVHDDPYDDHRDKTLRVGKPEHRTKHNN